jgi:hypothetical protein
VVDLVAQVAINSLLVGFFYRLWTNPWRVPLNYSGDALAQTAVVQQIRQTGWMFRSTRQGVPVGYASYDFPFGGDALHYAIIKALTLFTSDAFLVVNLYFWLGFVFIGLSTFVVCRWWGMRRLLAHAMAIVYAFAPFHFLRGTPHLTLSAYWGVPVGAAVTWMIMSDRPPFVTRDEQGQWQWTRWNRRATAMVVACIVIALSGGYSAIFAVLTMALAWCVSVSRHRRVLPAIGAIAPIIGVMVVLAMSTLPSIGYWGRNGRNSEAGTRLLAEQDLAPLRPSQLLAPIPGHRFGVFDQLSDAMRRGASEVEPTQFLGALGAIGLLLAIGSVIATAAGRRPGYTTVDPRIGLIVLGCMVAGAFGSVGWISALVGFSSIRAWGRLSIVIAFWSLMALTLAVQRWLQRSRLAARPRWAASAVVLVVVAALFDQVPTWRDQTSYASGLFAADQRYFHLLEKRLGSEATVFELPYVSYPEAALVNGIAPAEMFKPMLHTRDTAFSFGAMRGRGGDWMATTAEYAPDDLIDALVSIGYRAILIDGDMLNDQERIDAIVAAAGSKPIVSETGRYVLVELGAAVRSVVERISHIGLVATREREVGRPEFHLDDALTAPFTERLLDDSSTVTVLQPNEWTGTITFEVRSLTGQPGTVNVQLGDQPAQSVAIPDADWVTVSVPATLTAERTQLAISTAIAPIPGDLRNATLAIQNLEARDPLDP